MIDSGKDEPKSMRDIFPGVSPDRIAQLLEHPDFVAHESLGRLYEDLTAKKARGEDVTEALSALEASYTPSIQALQERIRRVGYNQHELSAAMMASKGKISIR